MTPFDTDTWHEIFATMRRNLLRTFMTAFGVFWGILILMVLLAFGDALKEGVSKNLRGFGSSQIYLWGGKTSLPYKGTKPGTRIRYTLDDLSVIGNNPGVDIVAPRNSLGGYRGANNVSHDGKTGPFKIIGDMPEWNRMQPSEFYEGRYINRQDIEDKRKVAVIGEQVYEMLFPKGESALGKTLLIQNVYFQVVGRVRSTRAGESAEEDAATVFVPFSTFDQLFQKGSEHVGWFAITSAEGYGPEEVYESLRSSLREQKGVHPQDTQAVRGYNAAAKSEKLDRLFGGIRIFMWFVGVATLMAGALGVSNIMLIVVKDRTKEIGIRKALGARPSKIVSQVMLESITLTVVAGYMGLLAAVGLIEGLGSAMAKADLPFGAPSIDFSLAIAALAILVVSGAVAGFVPARHAASVNPVLALRAE